MQSTLKYKFEKVASSLLPSAVRVGVKPCKPYQSEGLKEGTKVEEYPMSAVGLLKISIDGQEIGYSTGSLIGPKLVLTAAHHSAIIRANRLILSSFLTPSSNAAANALKLAGDTSLKQSKNPTKARIKNYCLTAQCWSCKQRTIYKSTLVVLAITSYKFITNTSKPSPT